MMEFILKLDPAGEDYPDCYVLKIQEKEKEQGIMVMLDLRRYKESPEAIVASLINGTHVLQQLASRHYIKVGGELLFIEKPEMVDAAD